MASAVRRSVRPPRQGFANPPRREYNRFAMTHWDCDLIVIGSGFGGAVVAHRAASAGLRVIVLERGREMTAETYEAMRTGGEPIFHGQSKPGLLELHRLKGLLALSASAVGGGSNIYTAVTIRPPREVFEAHWPVGVDFDSLAPYLDRVEETICPTPLAQPLPRTTALETIGRDLGREVTRLPLAMNWPDDEADLQRARRAGGVYHELVTWLSGGGAARKRTLAQTYLAEARIAGAQIRPLHTVDAITPEAGGYAIEFTDLSDDSPREGTVRAPRAVLAAGTLGTNRLLLRCRDVLQTLPALSDALGRGFSTNADFGGLLVGPDHDMASDAGPPVTAWIDQWQDDRLYVMETGLVPYNFGSFTGLLNPAKWFGGMRLQPVERCTWSFGTMGVCDNPGRLVLGNKGALVHRFDAARGASFHETSLAALKDIAGAAGGRLVVPPKPLVRRLPVTVHPLGGAAMADSTDGGAANPVGEVFGHPGLSIADGSLLPAPTGVPPSMTIAALAERVAEHLIQP